MSDLPMHPSSATLLDAILRVRRAVIILLHILLICVANALALLLRFDGQVPPDYVEIAINWLPSLVAIRLLFLWRLRLFEGLWKYTGLWDLRNIVLAVSSSSGLLLVVAYIVSGDTRYPRSVYIIDAILLICLMSAVRLSRRIYRELVRSPGSRRVLIYGAGNAGEMIVRDMRQNAAFNADPIGFIDDDPHKTGQRIHGVPVLGTRDCLADIVGRKVPDDVIIAIPSAPREVLRGIVRALEQYKVRISTIPRMSDVIGTRVSLTDIRQLNVEDLLSRAPIGLDSRRVRDFLHRRRVLVTGAGGSIGSELCRQIALAEPSSLVMLERYENSLFSIHNELVDAKLSVDLQPFIADVTDVQRVQQLLALHRPDVVFHAAAHKHVPLMERNPCEAIKNNVMGTRIIADACLANGVQRFVLISTDKAVNPTSVMGAAKKVAEMIVRLTEEPNATKFVVVRFGNVLGSNGSVVPRFMAQVANGGPVTVTHPEMRRYFMLIPEAVQLVLHAAALDDRGHTFVLDMGEQVKVADLARAVIRLSGYVPDRDVAIEFTGVRPGEKLSEELVADEEVAEPSSTPKVLRVRPNGVSRPGAELRLSIAKLERFAQEGNAEAVLEQLSVLIPEYRSHKPMAVERV